MLHRSVARWRHSPAGSTYNAQGTGVSGDAERAAANYFEQLRVARELVLLKLKVRPERTDTVRGHVVRLGGRVLDPAPDGFIVELTGSEAEVNTFVNELARDAELLEVVRSGALGIGRNARPLRVVR